MDLSQYPWLCREPDGSIRSTGPTPAAFLSGSFNPLHHGHRLLAQAASQRLGLPVAFELSVTNVDKPELGVDQIRERAEQFANLAPVYVTRAMTFAMKASLFPDAVIIVGVDTAERIISPRVYGNDPALRDQALCAIREQGCRILVAGRLNNLGQFYHLHEVEIPDRFRDLFEAIPEEHFRVDVSSTILRAQERPI